MIDLIKNIIETISKFITMIIDLFKSILNLFMKIPTMIGYLTGLINLIPPFIRGFIITGLLYLVFRFIYNAIRGRLE